MVASLADFLWLNDKVLLTCSKDGKVIQQLVGDGEKPVEKAVSPTCNSKYMHELHNFT